uniref:Uncharacterized protein n=1 Tax=Arundo donax TaxID=35708 RepID=A0A0A9H2H5_ARUDO
MTQLFLFLGFLLVTGWEMISVGWRTQV